MLNLTPETIETCIAAVVLLLTGGAGVKGYQVAKDKRNGKKQVSGECPVLAAGGTPITKEVHDEIAIQRMRTIDQKFQNVNDKLEFLKEGQVQVKADVKQILDKIGNIEVVVNGK